GSDRETNVFDTGGIFGVGVGYQFNNWFRADIPGQYRGNANYKGMELYNTPVGGGAVAPGVDNYSASKSEFLFLANAYADLGTWWCVTPFVGAGIGTTRVSIANFTDTGFFHMPPFPSAPVPSFNYAGSASQWNFAWAAHAGLAYHVTPGLTVELAYSFVSMGNGMTGSASSFDQVTNTTHAPFQFHNIYSNDVKLGVRWNLDSPPAYAPPLITK